MQIVYMCRSCVHLTCVYMCLYTCIYIDVCVLHVWTYIDVCVCVCVFYICKTYLPRKMVSFFEVKECFTCTCQYLEQQQAHIKCQINS